jgi:hypothetical protein
MLQRIIRLRQEPGPLCASKKLAKRMGGAESPIATGGRPGAAKAQDPPNMRKFSNKIPARSPGNATKWSEFPEGLQGFANLFLVVLWKINALWA